MRKLFVIISVFMALCAGAQQRQLINAYGYDWQRGGFVRSLTPPKDTFALPLKDSNSIAVKSGVPYIYFNGRWNNWPGGVGSGNITSVFGRTGIITAQSSDYSSFYQPLGNYITPADTVNRYIGLGWLATLAAKQNQLISGTNIKTINGVSLLGGGDIPVSGGGGTTIVASDYLNVMDYGAISGDTSVDNSIAITRAIDSAHAKHITRVLIPVNAELYVKQSAFIRHSNITLDIQGKIIARGGSNTRYSVRRGCVILAAPKVAYHGALNDRLSNIKITGNGTIDLTQVVLPVAAELLDGNGSFSPAYPDDWGGGHAVEVNSVTNAVVENITVLNSIMGTIGFGNIINGSINNTHLIGLRNVKMSPTYMLNGNMINVYVLDPQKKGGDSTYIGNVTVKDNYIDGLTEGNVWPFVMDGVTPTNGANIGVNIATEPFNIGNGKMTGIQVINNKVRHAVWGMNAEGQFEAGSNSGCIMNMNTVEKVYHGICNITNSWDRDNAHSYMISNNVIKEVFGDAIQCYGGDAIISDNIIEDLGIGRNDNAQIQQFFAGTYRFSTAVKMFPFNLSANSAFAGGNVVVNGLVVRNSFKTTAEDYRCQIRGFDIFTREGQTFKNVKISNVVMDVKGSTQGEPEMDLASGLVISGGVKDLTVTNSTFEGFAGSGAIFKFAPDGQAIIAPRDITFDNVTFKNNNGGASGPQAQYAGWPTIIVWSKLNNFKLYNCKFVQDSLPVNRAFAIMGAWANGGVPFVVDGFYCKDNQYTGYNYGKDVYDFQQATGISVDDDRYFSTRSSIPDHYATKYYSGMKFYKETVTDNVIGWVCRTTGIGSAAVFDTLFSGRSTVIGGSGAVSSVFGRTGDVTANVNDYAAHYFKLSDTAAKTWDWNKITGKPSFSANNFANADLTLTGNRTHNLLTNELTLIQDNADLTHRKISIADNGIRLQRKYFNDSSYIYINANSENIKLHNMNNGAATDITLSGNIKITADDGPDHNDLFVYPTETILIKPISYQMNINSLLTDLSLVTKKYVDSTRGLGGGGTVTSVGMSVPTGLTLTGSPITTSGTFNLSLTPGYNFITSAQLAQLAFAYQQSTKSEYLNNGSGGMPIQRVVNDSVTTIRAINPVAGTGITIDTTASNDNKIDINISVNTGVKSVIGNAGTSNDGLISIAAFNALFTVQQSSNPSGTITHNAGSGSRHNITFTSTGARTLAFSNNSVGYLCTFYLDNTSGSTVVLTLPANSYVQNSTGVYVATSTVTVPVGKTTLSLNLYGGTDYWFTTSF